VPPCACGQGAQSVGHAALIKPGWLSGLQEKTVFFTVQDLREIFDAIEGVPNIPKKLFGGFASWARGEQDPDWKKKGKKGPEKKRPW